MPEIKVTRRQVLVVIGAVGAALVTYASSEDIAAAVSALVRGLSGLLLPVGALLRGLLF